MSTNPLSGKDLLLPVYCPDCENEKIVMKHSSDYKFHWIDIYQCFTCGCRIEIIHTRISYSRPVKKE